MIFYIVLTLVILQRLYELRIASQNANKMKSMGGYEVGQEHYKWMVLLHTSFFLSLLLEFQFTPFSVPSWWWIPLTVFILAQGLRIWVINSLGVYWNTRIYVVPNTQIQIKGPYRWIRHPNYLVVIIEIIAIPLTFGLYFTAILFTILNFIMITYRISIEEQALRTLTSYSEAMAGIPRILPFWRKG